MSFVCLLDLWSDNAPLYHHSEYTVDRRKNMDLFEKWLGKNEFGKALGIVRNISHSLISAKYEMVEKLITTYFFYHSRTHNNVVVPYILKGHELPGFMFSVFWNELSLYSDSFRTRVLNKMKNTEDHTFYAYLGEKLSGDSLSDRILALEWIGFIKDDVFTPQIESMLSESQGDGFIKAWLKSLKNKHNLTPKTLQAIKEFQRQVDRVEIQIALLDYYQGDENEFNNLAQSLLKIPDSKIRHALIKSAIISDDHPWIKNLLSQEYHNKDKAAYLYDYLSLCLLHEREFERIEWKQYLNHSSPRVREICFSALMKSDVFKFEPELWKTFFADLNPRISSLSCDKFLSFDDVNKIGVWRDLTSPKNLAAFKNVLKAMKASGAVPDESLWAIFGGIDNLKTRAEIISLFGDGFGQFRQEWEANSSELKAAMIKYWGATEDKENLRILDGHVLKIEHDPFVLNEIIKVLNLLENRNVWVSKILAINEHRFSLSLIEMLPSLQSTEILNVVPVSEWVLNGTSDVKLKYLNLNFKKMDQTQTHIARQLLNDDHPLVSQKAFTLLMSQYKMEISVEKVHKIESDASDKLNSEPKIPVSSPIVRDWLKSTKPSNTITSKTTGKIQSVSDQFKSRENVPNVKVPKSTGENILTSGRVNETVHVKTEMTDTPQKIETKDDFSDKKTYGGTSNVLDQIIDLISDGKDRVYFQDGLMELANAIAERNLMDNPKSEDDFVINEGNNSPVSPQYD